MTDTPTALHVEHDRTHTRFWFAVMSTVLTFAYLFFTKEPDTGGAFMFLSVVAGGFGLSKATQHLKLK